MKLIKYTLLLSFLAILAPAQYIILDPPWVYIAPCPVHVVLYGDVKEAIRDLKRRECENITVRDSAHSAAHQIVYGVRVYEEPMVNDCAVSPCGN